MLWQMGNKGGAISKGIAQAAKIGGASLAPIVIPSIVGAAPWVIGLMAALGPNLFSSYSNQGIITNNGDAINHYFFNRP